MAIDSQGMKWRGGVALIPGDQIRAIPQRQRSKGELAPLPSGAQFLNVIESVFGGMARAVIYKRNYLSVDECKRAIDRYFRERNDAFAKNPKRAGKVLGQGARAARVQRGEQLQGPEIPISTQAKSWFPNAELRPLSERLLMFSALQLPALLVCWWWDRRTTWT